MRSSWFHTGLRVPCGVWGVGVGFCSTEIGMDGDHRIGSVLFIATARFFLQYSPQNPVPFVTATAMGAQGVRPRFGCGPQCACRSSLGASCRLPLRVIYIYIYIYR